jgi:hypothetical protein
MPPESLAHAPRKPTARSRISNGHDLLPNIDGRSATARRYRDIASQILNDQGGEARCSESRLQLIRRFAAAAVLAENLEAKLAGGENIDVTQHALLCSTLTRLATRIGIDRIPRDLTPTLNEYLAARALETRRDVSENDPQAPLTGGGGELAGALPTGEAAP